MQTPIAGSLRIVNERTFGELFVHPHSKRSTTVPIVSHMSISQYLPVITFTRKYCELLTCGTIGTYSTSFGVRHPQDIEVRNFVAPYTGPQAAHHEMAMWGCALIDTYCVGQITGFLSVRFMGTFWALFSQHFFFPPKKVLRKKCCRNLQKSSSISGQLF